MSKTRKWIVVEVETDLTDKQIETHGASIYLCEPDGECHLALTVEVEPRRNTRGWQVDVDARLDALEKIVLGREK